MPRPKGSRNRTTLVRESANVMRSVEPTPAPIVIDPTEQEFYAKMKAEYEGSKDPLARLKLPKEYHHIVASRSQKGYHGSIQYWKDKGYGEVSDIDKALLPNSDMAIMRVPMAHYNARMRLVRESQIDGAGYALPDMESDDARAVRNDVRQGRGLSLEAVGAALPEE